MAYNTQKMLTDVEGKPIPQLYDPTSDKFLPLTLDTFLLCKKRSFAPFCRIVFVKGGEIHGWNIKFKG